MPRLTYIFVLITGLSLRAYGQGMDLQKAASLSQTRPDSALLLLRKLYIKAQEKANKPLEGQCLQQMGNICYNQGHYSQALDFYLHADRVFTEAGKPLLAAANMGDIGVLYYYNKQLNRSRSFYNKALSIYRQYHDVKGEAKILGNIGHLYEKQHRYDSAFYYQRKALEGYQRANFKQGAAKIYENLGSIYEDLARYDSAYVNFNRSLQLYREQNDKTGSIEVINNLGDILRKTGKYKESVVQSRRALQLATGLGNIYQQASSAKDLGKAFELMGQMDSAYHYAELSRKYSLDVYSKDGVKQTAFLQVLYDFNKKSDEIDRLNNIRKVNRIIAIAVAIVAVLVVILLVVLFSRQRLKLRDQQAIVRQKAAEHEVMRLELKNQHLEEAALKQQLELRSKELSNHTLSLIKNNQFLEQLRASLQAMVKDERRDQKKQMQQLITQINENFSHEQHWREFTVAFEQVHQQFFESLRNRGLELTPADMRLIALIKMNLDSADIATLLGISTDSLRVSRYRLRKKLNISQGDSLSLFVQTL